MGIRCFLAFELPPEMKAPLAQASEDMRHYHMEVRWVKVENIHITLVFLGNLSVDTLRSIGPLVGPVCREYGPFSINLDGVGIFGSLRHPRVIWAGVGGDVDRLSDFRNDLIHNLRVLGTKQEERTFTPHLTLGRFRKGAKPASQVREVLSAHGGISSPPCVAHELVLFQSDLQPGGAVYSRMDAWSLTSSP